MAELGESPQVEDKKDKIGSFDFNKVKEKKILEKMQLGSQCV